MNHQITITNVIGKYTSKVYNTKEATQELTSIENCMKGTYNIPYTFLNDKYHPTTIGYDILRQSVIEVEMIQNENIQYNRIKTIDIPTNEIYGKLLAHLLTNDLYDIKENELENIISDSDITFSIDLVHNKHHVSIYEIRDGYSTLLNVIKER